METDRWQRLWDLFHGALERPEGEARASWLAEACGADAALRAELESLLAAHEGSGDSIALDPSAIIASALPEPAQGDSIGPYRILRRIGEGGMGLVFEALQEEPVRRRVALKLVKPGMDSREVLRRFSAERQALARMDHSSIARVFDVGATPEGRPYFAMELVDGVPITEHCDAARLPIGRRLELARRGLPRGSPRPPEGGDPPRPQSLERAGRDRRRGGPCPRSSTSASPARSTPRLGEGTLLTHRGQLVGTPETMSPEQAAMSADLDTRTDIYSLGALLYELLAGAPPFAAGGVPFLELLRRIREEEPPAPSARVARLEAADAVAVAAARGSEPARLRRELAGELDWIVAKAMAKERDRRYGSAAELADDLERYLALRPILAGPPSGLYRLRKLLRRHRVEAAAAAALLVALVGFGAAMAVQSKHLARSLELQEQERETASRVSDFLVELLEQPDPARARGEEVTVRKVLDRGAAKIADELDDQPEIQARLLETLGRVQLNLGLFDAAEPALTQALELRRRLRGPDHVEVAAALFKLGELEFERAHYDRALAFAEQSLAMRRRLLGERDPAVADSLDLVALLRREAGDLDAAAASPRAGARDQARRARRRRSGRGRELELRRHRAPPQRRPRGRRGRLPARARDLAQGVGRGPSARGDGDEQPGARRPRARQPRRGEAPVRAAGAAAPQAARSRSPGPARHARQLRQAAARHARSRRRGTHYGEALAIGRRALGDGHPQLASTMADFGGVLAKLGRLDQALELEERALAIRRAAFDPGHPTISASLRYLADVLVARGDRAGAARLYREALALDRGAGGPPPRVAAALEDYGLFLLDCGDPDGAEPLLREAAALLRAALPAGDRRTARVEGALGACLGALGRFDEGETLLVSSLAALATPETPETADARARLAELRSARAAGAR